MKIFYYSKIVIVSTCVLMISISSIAQPDADIPTDPEFHVTNNLYVNDSACIGFDCVNNSSFGFDTQILRENNLRIFFDDTSNSASFPNNDWRIRVNDSSNGGSAYYAIEDASAGRIPFRIDAGARSNALYVDAQGDIGIGTSTPFQDIHVKVGNTPTLRLEQDATSGFTPQTWDIAGNEAGFFIRDATHGSKLSFRIRPDAPTSAIDIMSDGTVQIAGDLEVLSDLRLKENIVPIENAIELINQLNAVSYHMNSELIPELKLSEEKQYGVIAQELEQVIPELVSINNISGDLLEGMKSVNYMQLIPLLIKANQEQSANTIILNEKLNAQAKEISELKSTLKLVSISLLELQNQ